MGQYAYASSALLAACGVAEEARDPLRLLTAPPKQLLTPVERMERAFYQDTQVGEGALVLGWAVACCAGRQLIEPRGSCATRVLAFDGRPVGR